MGDPKKLKKKFQKPSHPWRKQRLDEEAIIMKEYALKNKKELYRINTLLSKMKSNVKVYAAAGTSQADKEKKQLFDKCVKYSLLKQTSNIDDILNIGLKDIMERRLQTVVLRKALAKTMKQARQFIVHGHIMVGEKAITSPAYLVSVDEEPKLKFVQFSPLYNPDHPERSQRVETVAELKEKERMLHPEKELTPEAEEARIIGKAVGGEQQ